MLLSLARAGVQYKSEKRKPGDASKVLIAARRGKYRRVSLTASSCSNVQLGWWSVKYKTEEKIGVGCGGG